jgi:hypothetical protein
MAGHGRVLDQQSRHDGDDRSPAGGFDMPVMIEFPVAAEDVGTL